MSDTVISVENLTKRYRIGSRDDVPDTLIGSVVAAAKSPLRNYRRLRSLSRFGQNESDDVLWALKDVSFEVKRGDVVGIIGRNGAGKSTLLKVLSRITEPTSGRARMRGRVSALLEVGTGFHDELTGRENVYLNGTILGMRKREIDRKFDEIVDFSGVERFLDTPVKRYSSGMKVRLAFAVAAHLDPEILIVDEVLAVGDAEFQRKCLGKMREVSNGGGRTVLFVSHNMPAVQNFCSRAILLTQGRKSIDSNAQEAVMRYLRGNDVVCWHDLKTAPRRHGPGLARFVKLELRDDAGVALEQAVCGKPLTIVLDYDASRSKGLKGVRVSLSLCDAHGQPLMLCSSELTNPELSSIPPRGRLQCKLPQFPLSGGDYRLSLFLMADGEIADWIEDAIPFACADGDFYGTGKAYPDGWGGKGVLVPYLWSVEPH